MRPRLGHPQSPFRNVGINRPSACRLTLASSSMTARDVAKGLSQSRAIVACSALTDRCHARRCSLASEVYDWCGQEDPPSFLWNYGGRARFRISRNLASRSTNVQRLVRPRGLEPPRVAPLAPQASASTNSAMAALKRDEK